MNELYVERLQIYKAKFINDQKQLPRGVLKKVFLKIS